ncbi:unnamed protein product [Trichogramma brassicae]|uniref:Reverse transcriptase domain-containing protein n=1 Tax=Trichogramma brassicae TaxID=86971 RepID=A0A6H5I4U0_9HYME|nr:unnamed protein product [Trichogramma brassicae]
MSPILTRFCPHARTRTYTRKKSSQLARGAATRVTWNRLRAVSRASEVAAELPSAGAELRSTAVKRIAILSRSISRSNLNLTAGAGWLICQRPHLLSCGNYGGSRRRHLAACKVLAREAKWRRRYKRRATLMHCSHSCHAAALRSFAAHAAPLHLHDDIFAGDVRRRPVRGSLHTLSRGKSTLDLGQLRCCSKDTTTVPWYSPELRQLRVARDKAWRTFRRTRTDSDRARYKTLRNRFRTAARDAACRHYRERFRDCTDSASKWRMLGRLGLGSRAGRSAGLPVGVDELNQHFVRTFQSRAAKPETSASSVHPDERFYFRHVQLAEVVEAVRGLEPRPGALMTCLRASCTGVFRSAWKTAIVRPVPKKSAPRDAGDFRPISLLCAMSKILERLAHAQLTDYIESRNLLDKYQSGFRVGHSTQTALLRIIDDVREAVESQEVTLMAAVDLSRAFDVVNHSILLNKLKRLGWSDLACCWIQSYLTGRTQLVIGPRGERSATLARMAGVPQGSVLGPLLYALFANDAPRVLENCRHHIYADDTTIYVHGPFTDVRRLTVLLSEDLGRLAAWASDSDLVINPNKTKAMWLGTRRYVSQLRAGDVPPPVIEGSPVLVVDRLKLLGVTLDGELTWRGHVSAVTARVFAALSSLRRCGDYLAADVRAMLVSTLVFPHVDYCAALFLGISAEQALRIKRCMNAAVRFITGLKKWQHITPQYAKLNILPYEKRVQCACLGLLASVLRNGRPDYWSTEFEFREAPAGRSSRRDELELVIVRANTDCALYSFTVGAARLWNGLPYNIRKSFGSLSFKGLLRQHLLEI